MNRSVSEDFLDLDVSRTLYEDWEDREPLESNKLEDKYDKDGIGSHISELPNEDRLSNKSRYFECFTSQSSIPSSLEQLNVESEPKLILRAKKSMTKILKIRLLDDIKSRSNQILDELKGGSLILIAYDADHNHQPCKKKGHKAHWALLIGMIATK
uniref:Actin maturation protease n=1 Tax=Trichogramma kaykai TaxID=54128 RepID=A0ABD2VZK8_9HYME